MRTMSILICGLFIKQINAQIPNSDFEKWTYYSGRPEPNGWTTYNQFTNNVYHVVPTLPGYESDTALTSRTIYTGISTYPGFASATFSLTYRPVGLAWYSQHVRLAFDTVRITCTLDPGASPLATLNWEPITDADTNGFVFNYAPISYSGPANPTTAKITVEGGDDNAYAQTGTFITVDQIHFCDAPPPSGTITISGPSNAHEGDTVVFTATTVAGATNYVWTVPLGATLISGAGTESIVVRWGPADGSVSVTARNDCGPGPSDSASVDVITGVEHSEPARLVVSPNPAQDVITITGHGLWDGRAITLTDLAGRTILTSCVDGATTTLNTSDFPVGIYLLRVGNNSIAIAITR